MVGQGIPMNCTTCPTVQWDFLLFTMDSDGKLGHQPEQHVRATENNTTTNQSNKKQRTTLQQTRATRSNREQHYNKPEQQEAKNNATANQL